MYSGIAFLTFIINIGLWWFLAFMTYREYVAAFINDDKFNGEPYIARIGIFEWSRHHDISDVNFFMTILAFVGLIGSLVWFIYIPFVAIVATLIALRQKKRKEKEL